MFISLTSINSHLPTSRTRAEDSKDKNISIEGHYWRQQSKGKSSKSKQNLATGIARARTRAADPVNVPIPRPPECEHLSLLLQSFLLKCWVVANNYIPRPSKS